MTPYRGKAGGCNHRTADDFSHFADGVRIWTCSGCGAEGPWGPTWTYYGNLECKRCQAADIEWTACSEACVLPTMDDVPKAPKPRKKRKRGCGKCGKPGHYAPTCGVSS